MSINQSRIAREVPREESVPNKGLPIFIGPSKAGNYSSEWTDVLQPWTEKILTFSW
jgi:hypothetical protein